MYRITNLPLIGAIIVGLTLLFPVQAPAPISSSSSTSTPLTPGSDGDSNTTSSPSGLEIINNAITLLRGGGNNQTMLWDETTDQWGFSPTIFDDDGELVASLIPEEWMEVITSDPGAGAAPATINGGKIFFRSNTTNADSRPWFCFEDSGDCINVDDMGIQWTQMTDTAAIAKTCASNNCTLTYANGGNITAILTGTDPDYTLTLTGSAGSTVNTLVAFLPVENEPPASGFATFDTRNSHPVLDFDGGAVECALWTFVMPDHYDDVDFTVYWGVSMTSATTNDTDWDISFERIGNEVLDIDSDSFDTAISLDGTTVSDTSGKVLVHSQAFTKTQSDELVSNEQARIKICRDGTSDADNTDAELHWVQLRM